MVVHPAVGVNPMPKTLDALGHQPLKLFPVLVAIKNRLTTVAAKHYVIQAARYVNTWFSCHAKTVTGLSQ